MRFKINNVDYRNHMEEREIEITTLEELYALAREVNESLIVRFPGVSSNAWDDGEPNMNMGEITIYDGYIE